MTTEPLRIIVSGLVAQYPLGGVAWDYVQYVVALHRMGHDVYYFEDTGQWPYDPAQGGISAGCGGNVRHLASVMARFGLEDRWAYCFPWESQWYGMSDARRRNVVETSDVVINVSGTLRRPDDLRNPRNRLVYIDSDPGFTQVKLARGQSDFGALVGAHDVHFSFGETLPGHTPPTDFDWLPTRQPVVLAEWEPQAGRRDVCTTVMNWTSYKAVTFDGITYGQKDAELLRFLQLPSITGVPLELAVSEGKTARTPHERLRHMGWRVVDPDRCCPDLDSYRRYLRSSMAEWSVAKQGYVAGRTGWFSCRSACYLAAGRPVVVQDTGFSDVLPTGEGLLAFSDLEGSRSALDEIAGDWSRHSESAHAIAAEYFDSGRVLTRLLEMSDAAEQRNVRR